MKFAFFIYGIFLLIAAPAYAQSGQIDMPSIAAASVSLTNISNQPIHFGLQPVGGELSQFTIDSNNQETYEATGGVSAFTIIIRTDEKIITKTLSSGSRYQLFWNNAINAFDVAELAPR